MNSVVSTKLTRLDLLKFAWPLIIANSFWNLQLTIDRIFLGQYSTESLAAAVSALGVFWAPMALLQQSGAYVSTFVAQYLGSKQEHKVGEIMWQSFYASIFGGVAFIGLQFLSFAVFQSFGHSATITTFETEYFDSLTYSAMPAALMASVSAFFMGIGQNKVVLLLNGTGLLFNAVLDPIFIFGMFGLPELGISGAGYATAIANWAGAIVGLYLFMKKVNESTYRVRSDWQLKIEPLKRLLYFSFPSGLQWALEGLAFTCFLVFIGKLPNGDAALAASSITVTIMMLSILPALGLAQATAVIVGQDLGSGTPEAAEQTTWYAVQIALGYIATVGLSFLLIPNFYISWFARDNAGAIWNDAQALVPYLLMFVAFFTLFDCLNIILSFALKGAGDTYFVSAIALVLPWPLMVVPTWYFSENPYGIYYSWAAASFYGITQALIFLWRFRGGAWKKMLVIEKPLAA